MENFSNDEKELEKASFCNVSMWKMFWMGLNVSSFVERREIYLAVSKYFRKTFSLRIVFMSYWI